MNWSDSNLRAAEFHQGELRAQAERDRLVRQARRARPRPAPHRWRRRVGMVLIAAGESLIDVAPDLAHQPGRPSSQRGHTCMP